MTTVNLSQHAHADGERDILCSRVLAAPRDLVFRAWTEVEHLGHWFGPRGFKTTTQSHAARPGGVWSFIMHGPDGTDYPNRITYTEVVRPERLVYTHGSPRPSDPPPFHVTVTFADTADIADGAGAARTEVVMRMRFDTQAQRDATTHYALEGNRQTLDRLAEWLVVQQPQAPEELVIARIFNAPRERLFKVWTEAAHLAKWWGPKGMHIAVAKLEVRPGGMFHYSMQAPDGSVMWGRFVYREVQAPERMVFVSAFSDAQGGITRHPMAPLFPAEVENRVTFQALADGRTLLITRGGPLNASAEEKTFFASQQMRESMRGGFAGTYQQLDEYLAKLA